MKQPTHIKIVGGFNRKEKWAFEWIFKIYRPFVFELASRILKNNTDAEDVTMEVFLKMQNIKEHQASIKDIRDMLYQFTRNCSLNERRDKLRERNFIASQSEEVPGISEAEMYRNETIAALYYEIYRVKNKLTPLCEKVFNRYFIGQISDAEIANEMHIKLKTVRNSKAKALRIMRMEIKPRASHVFLLTLLP